MERFAETDWSSDNPAIFHAFITKAGFPSLLKKALTDTLWGYYNTPIGYLSHKQVKTQKGNEGKP